MKKLQKHMIALALALAFLFGIPPPSLAGEAPDIAIREEAVAGTADIYKLVVSVKMSTLKSFQMVLSFDCGMVRPVNGSTYAELEGLGAGSADAMPFRTYMGRATAVWAERTGRLAFLCTFGDRRGVDAAEGVDALEFYYRAENRRQWNQQTFWLETDYMEGSILKELVPDESQAAALMVKDAEGNCYGYGMPIGDTMPAPRFQYANWEIQVPGTLELLGEPLLEIPMGDGSQAPAELSLEAVVWDVMGERMESPEIDWSLRSAPEGVSLSASGVSATLRAAGAAEQGTAVVLASCAGLEAEKPVAIFRQPPVGTALRILIDGGPAGGEFLVGRPEQGTKDYHCTALLLDQYGQSLPGTVVWSLFSSPAGIAAEQDGAGYCIRVSEEAEPDAAFTLRAELSGQPAISGRVTFVIRGLEVNWDPVHTALLETPFVYGEPLSRYPLPPSGEAVTGGETVTGVFTYRESSAAARTGQGTVEIIFTVTQEGLFAGASVIREFPIEVQPRALTIQVEDAKRAYRAENPGFSFSISQGTLADGDTEAALGVTLRCEAPPGAGAGSRFPISGEGQSENYRVTVLPGTLTVLRADIERLSPLTPPAAILANDGRNTGWEGLLTILPGQVEAVYQGGTERLLVEWSTPQTGYQRRGGRYQFTGTVQPGENFNPYSEDLSVTLEVRPVTAALEEALPSQRWIPVAQEDWSHAGFGLPDRLTLRCDSGVGELSCTEVCWQPSPEQLLREVGERQRFTAEGFPEWITLAQKPAVELQVVQRLPVELELILPERLEYGDACLPLVRQEPTAEGENSAYRYSYQGVDGTVYGPSGQAPTALGTYRVTVTLESQTHEGSGRAEFQIVPKTLTPAMVWPLEELIYTGDELCPALLLTSNRRILSPGRDYAVDYEHNREAGQARALIRGMGNYTGGVTVPFDIRQRDLSKDRPEIRGIPQVEQTLAAAVAGLREEALCWQWYRNGQPIPGATERSYRVTPRDSNQRLTVRAWAESANCVGESQESAPVSIERQQVGGAVRIVRMDGTRGLIRPGDPLTVQLDAMLPEMAREGCTFQWELNGRAIPGAAGREYRPTETDRGRRLTVTVTPAGDFAGTLTSGAVTVGSRPLAGTVAVVGPGDGLIVPGTRLTAQAKLETGADYTLQWLRDGREIVGADRREYLVTKADLGKSITVCIRGTGEFTGELVSPDLEIPAQAPDAPVPNVTSGDRELLIAWASPADNGSPILYYLLRGSNFPEVRIPAGETQYRMAGLLNGTRYQITLTAVNTVGASEPGSAAGTPKGWTSPPSGGGTGGMTGKQQPSVQCGPGGTAVLGEDGTELAIFPEKGYRILEVLVNGNPLGTIGYLTGLRPTDRVLVRFEKVPAPSFADVAPERWSAGDISYLAELGILEGVEETLFLPERPVRRGELVKMLALLAGAEPEKTATERFTDLPSGAWYTPYVSWAYQAGIVSGVTDRLFAPEWEVSRQDLAVMLYRFLRVRAQIARPETEVLPFRDETEIAPYAREAVVALHQADLLSGLPDGRFAPGETATREQVAHLLALIHRL